MNTRFKPKEPGPIGSLTWEVEYLQDCINTIDASVSANQEQIADLLVKRKGYLSQIEELKAAIAKLS